MFKFIKDILKPESGPFTIPYQQIPEWLAAEDEVLDGELKSATSAARVPLEHAIRNLQGAADELSGAEVNAEVHARLGKIVQSSLPLFVRALNTSTSRPLPEEPEAFYAAAVEILKGALKSLSGPGRYLRAAFPEEMRGIRTTLDTFGREVNALSEKFAAIRSQKAVLQEVRKNLADLNSARIAHAALLERQKAAVEDAARHEERQSDARGRLERLRQEAGYVDVQATADRINESARQIESLEREFSTLAAPLSRISLKVQKVAARQGDKTVERTMGSFIDALQGFPLTAGSDLMRAAQDAVPLLHQKLESHAVEVKSREERELLARPDQLVRRIGELVQRYRETAAQRDSLAQQIETNPVLVQEKALEEEIRQIEERRKADVRFLETCPGETDRLNERMTALESALCRSVARRTNRPTVLVIDGRKATCAPV